MRVAICAGPATTGKTSVLRHATRKLLQAGSRVAFLKLDVQYADEDELLAKEFGIPTRKVYTGELCPDHCHVMVLGDAMRWAEQSDCDVLLVETAGLCLRCAPYVDGGLGMIVLEATSGMNLPLKVGPMLSLADIAVVTKIDRVSQAEREVFRATDSGRGPQCHGPRGQRPARHRHRPAGDGDPRDRRSLRSALPPRQPAGGHLHDLRRQEGNRLAGALRRGAGVGEPDFLSRRIAVPQRIYFDNAATTPPDPRVLEAMRPYLDQFWGNPSSLYAEGRQAREAVDRARAQVADLLGAESGEIVFTASGTEADNLALQGTLLAAGVPGSHLITSAIEHPAILACCRQLERLGRGGDPAAGRRRGTDRSGRSGTGDTA